MLFVLTQVFLRKPFPALVDFCRKISNKVSNTCQLNLINTSIMQSLKHMQGLIKLHFFLNFQYLHFALVLKGTDDVSGCFSISNVKNTNYSKKIKKIFNDENFYLLLSSNIALSIMSVQDRLSPSRASVPLGFKFHSAPTPCNRKGLN